MKRTRNTNHKRLSSSWLVFAEDAPLSAWPSEFPTKRRAKRYARQHGGKTIHFALYQQYNADGRKTGTVHEVG